MQLTCVVDYADSRYSTTLRPPGHLPLPSQKQPNRNSHQYTILYVLTPDNTLVKRRAKLLHNIWHHSFPIVETTCLQRWKVPYLTFDSTLIQRWITLLSNVWQYSYLTLDNTFIQRWTITLSAVWKCLKIIFVYFVWISIMIIGKSMCGRSVVENTDFGAIDHSLYFCLIVDYTTSVVVWSKFLENLFFLFPSANFQFFRTFATNQ